MSGAVVLGLVVLGGLVLGYGWAAVELLVSSRAGWLVVALVVVAALALRARYA